MSAADSLPPPRPKQITPGTANVLLLLCAAIWGVSFLWQAWANEHVAPLTYVGIRCLLGGAMTLPLAMRPRVRESLRDPSRRRALWIGGLSTGLCMACASGFQQTGLKHTTITNTGFITGLYVVFVPFFGAMVGQRIGVPAWLAVLLAIAGMFLLSFHHATTAADFAEFVAGLNDGDLWILMCAATWGVHVQVVGWASKRTDPVALSVLQFLVGGALATLFALAFEEMSLDGIQAAAAPIVLSAVFAVAVAFTLQAIAQDVAKPTHAAILLSLESVFGALTGVFWLGERFDVRQAAGCALMLSAALVAQWPQKRPEPE